MSVNLKPCPFCGGEPILRDHDMWPMCSACQCEGPGTSFGMSRKRAVTLWNTRTPDPAVAVLEAEVARLREALDGLLSAAVRRDYDWSGFDGEVRLAMRKAGWTNPSEKEAG